MEISGENNEIIRGDVNLEKVIQDTKIVQKWRAGNWPPNHFSVVTYNLEPLGNGTRVTLLNERVPLERSEYFIIKMPFI